MDRRPVAPDQETAALVDDFLAAQPVARTRATSAKRTKLTKTASSEMRHCGQLPMTG
jgi:hypothetical protein